MEHLALYRKWRPQNFNKVIGQDDMMRVLKNAVSSGSAAHAYLFCGTRGTGKTSTARILAKALNCENPHDGEPCNECSACKAITDGSFMDVIEIDAASNRGINETKELLEKVHFVPVQGKYKVYIIDEVHMLTNEAFNAMLKTIEEPPDHVVFIMATTEARKVPLTILSRCQRFDFRPINEETLFGALSDIARAENIQVDEEAIGVLAEKARGSMRDALSLMDQAIGGERIMTAQELNRLTGSVPYAFWPTFFKSIAQNDLPAVFSAMDGVEEEGKDLRQFFRDFRNCAGDLLSGAAKEGKTRYQQVLKDCAACLDPAQILEIITICGESEMIFRYNRDGKAVCRFLLAKIMKSLYPGVPAAAITGKPPAKPTEKKRAEGYIFPNEEIAPHREQKKAGGSLPIEETPPWESSEPAPVPYPEEAPPEEESVPFPEDAPPEEEILPVLKTASPEKASPKEFTAAVLPDITIPPAELTSAPAVEKEAKPKKVTAPRKKKEETPETQAPAAKVSAEEEDLERIWADLLKTVRSKNKSTFTWLSHGTLTKATSGEIVVSYRSKDLMYIDKIKEPKHTTLVEEAIKEIFGESRRFKAEMTAAENNIEEMSLFD